MQRELGITFVHVTHTQLEAIALADLVVVMEKGKIRQAGAARDVYASRKDRYVAEFLGGQNVSQRPGARRSTDSLAVVSAPARHAASPCRSRLAPRRQGRLASPSAVRRDDVELVRDPAPRRPTARRTVPGRVTAIEYQGYFVKVMLDTDGNEEFVVYVPERKFFGNPLEWVTSCSRLGRSSCASVALTAREVTAMKIRFSLTEMWSASRSSRQRCCRELLRENARTDRHACRLRYKPVRRLCSAVSTAVGEELHAPRRCIDGTR